MKPKVKNTKLVAPKKLPVHNETPAPPLAEASATLPSAAKQRKQKKRLAAKLKRAAKMTATAVPRQQPQQPKQEKMLQQQPKQEKMEQQQKQKLHQKQLKQEKMLQQQPKQEKMLQQQPKQEKMEQQQKQKLHQQQPKQEKMLQQQPKQKTEHQQANKRKLPTLAPEKRPRLDVDGATNGGAAAAAAAPSTHSDRPGLLADTGPVRDPVLRAEIADCLRRRAASTVRIRRLPNRLRLSQITELCQGIQAARVPWNYATGRNKGVAFLEFASPEAAKRAVPELEGSKALGTRLTATIRGGDSDAPGDADADDISVDIDAYNCRRVVVAALHPSTTGQELKDLVGGSSVLRVDFLQGSKLLRKHAPAVAFLTFADERRALDAVNKFQGRVIRGRGTSWLLHKRLERPQHSLHRTQLVAFGVSKRVSDDDLLRAFPSSQNIDVRQSHGMAVVSYATEADCRTDFDACKGGVARVGKAKLRVQFGHAQFKPIEQRRAAAAAAQPRQEPQPRKQPQPPPKPQNIDPSLFNKAQLIVKNFKPATQESDLAAFLSGVRRVFFTANRRLAFVHFDGESAATAALEKLAREPLNGAKLKAMYAMDKPEKTAHSKQVQLEQQQQQQQQRQRSQEHEAMEEDGGDSQQQQKPQKKLLKKFDRKPAAVKTAKPPKAAMERFRAA